MEKRQMDGERVEERIRQLAKAQHRFILPKDARQVVLVRHGSSTGKTVETVALGRLTISNPPLTEDGHAQAQAVAGALAGADISAVFTSPLQRTGQTAAPLVAACGLRPQVIEDLREVHLGDFEHSFYDHAVAGHPAIGRMLQEESWDAIPNAEQAGDFAARIRQAMASLLQAVAPGHTVVAFTHAAVIAEICRQATASRAFAFMSVENASLSRLLVLPDGSWKLRSFNEVSHLFA